MFLLLIWISNLQNRCVMVGGEILIFNFLCLNEDKQPWNLWRVWFSFRLLLCTDILTLVSHQTLNTSIYRYVYMYTHTASEHGQKHFVKPTLLFQFLICVVATSQCDFQLPATSPNWPLQNQFDESIADSTPRYLISCHTQVGLRGLWEIQLMHRACVSCLVFIFNTLSGCG